MGDYTNMSSYYDLIMTSGYYDYQKIVENITRTSSFESVLEIGCGTGLILEELGLRQPAAEIMGVDLTEAMLSIASERLQQFPNISLSLQNVTNFDLQKRYDLAFSYGGVWYFVVDGDNEPFMVSHLYPEEENRQGLARVARHVNLGGQLLLGIQGPHHDYEKPVSNGMLYSQKIEPAEHGFIKHYYLADDVHIVMSQTINYRTYRWPEALALLSEHGFEHDAGAEQASHFISFRKV
ncbi:MAG: class I SAM-dependent methyltransferase [Oxalobacteraceae bacterium]